MKFLKCLTLASVITNVGAEIVLSSDFSGTTKDGTTMNDITWIAQGISTPAPSLTVNNSIQAQGSGNLFTTTDSEDVIAPANNTSNGGEWSVVAEFTTLSSPIDLENFELTYIHFNGQGALQNVTRDANYTVEIRDISDTALPSGSVTINTDNINTNPGASGAQTITFDLTGVTLAANTDYRLFVQAADADGPAGNNTGFDAFVLNGTGGASSPSEFLIREFAFDPAANTVTLSWNSQPGETFIIQYSTDALDWTATLSNDPEAADPEGTITTQDFDLTETGANGLPKVFFRVEKQP